MLVLHDPSERLNGHGRLWMPLPLWWQLVIDYPHKSFDNHRSQALEFRRLIMG